MEKIKITLQTEKISYTIDDEVSDGKFEQYMDELITKYNNDNKVLCWTNGTTSALIIPKTKIHAIEISNEQAKDI